MHTQLIAVTGSLAGTTFPLGAEAITSQTLVIGQPESVQAKLL